MKSLSKPLGASRGEDSGRTIQCLGLTLTVFGFPRTYPHNLKDYSDYSIPCPLFRRLRQRNFLDPAGRRGPNAAFQGGTLQKEGP